MKYSLIKVRNLILKNKQLFLGLGIGLLIAIPVGVIAFNNKEDSVQNEQTSVLKKSSDKQDKETESVSTPEQNSSQSNTTKTNGQSSTKKTTPSTTTQNTPTAQTNTPTPSELTSCVYKNGSKTGLKCPYSPPPSWSTLTAYNPCVNPAGTEVPCSDYLSTISIEGTAVRAPVRYVEYTYLCVFKFSNATSRLVTVGSGGSPDNIPDCSIMQASNYDLYGDQRI